ncbi:hypothetical protein MP228_003240 [Amoeboaphelidium protococcarum]|nr:hypothetical protein MP228_003240 [Amoeboaphelidium protococcarum]
MTNSNNNNLTFHQGAISAESRLSSLKQKGYTIWLTGLSAAGKSSIAVALEQYLVKQCQLHAYRLDGDNIRMGLNENLGFSAEDRSENIRRIAHVSMLFADSCTIAIAAFISPYEVDRQRARRIHEQAGIPFIEVHVDVELSIAESRDPKGLYKKARAGVLKHFTGIDDPYEVPLNPELRIDSGKQSVEQSVSTIVKYLEQEGLL